MKRTIIYILSGIIIFLSLICAGLYYFAESKFDSVITATKSQQTEIAKISTEVYDKTSISIVKTQTAMPTNSMTPSLTVTPSFTASPSITPSVTYTPTIIPCEISLSPAVLIYDVPSDSGKVRTISANEKVELLAQAERINWAKILINDIPYWVKSEDISTTCNVSSLPLSYLAGWESLGTIVFYDNSSTKYNWINENKEIIENFPLPGKNVNSQYFLDLGKIKSSQVSIQEQQFGHLDDFTIITSYAWNHSGDIAIRFWDDMKNYYEVRLNNNCVFELYDSGTYQRQQKVMTEKCFPEYSNYLELSVESTENTPVLRLKLNEAEAVVFNLPNNYPGAKVSWNLINNAGIKVYYFIVIEQ